MNRVLVLSASAGAGHLRAAEAVELAFKAADGGFDVRNIDVLQYTTKSFHKMYSQGYLDLVSKAPEVMGWLYNHFDKPYRNEKLRLAWEKLNLRPFLHLLEDLRPSWVVNTHFLPAEIISSLRAKGKTTIKQAVAVTDFDVHAMWLSRHVDHYFVARDEAKAHLAAMGVPPDGISVTGIPVHPVFSVEKDRFEMRRKHGLPADLPAVLVSAGGFGVGKVENMLESLLGAGRPLCVVAVAGCSAELKGRLEKAAHKANSVGKHAVKILGFTTDMDELMAAADLMVGKPGGLTTSEALARGLPMMVVNPIPGQEEHNSDMLLEEGAALRCNNLPALAWKIEKLLGTPDALKRLRENARRLGRPLAAAEIVRKAAGLFGSGVES